MKDFKHVIRIANSETTRTSRFFMMKMIDKESRNLGRRYRVRKCILAECRHVLQGRFKPNTVELAVIDFVNIGFGWHGRLVRPCERAEHVVCLENR